MDTLYHFVFSIIVGLAIGVHIKHKFRILVALAFLSVLVDVDHFFGLSARGTFHNIFFMFFIPGILFLIFYVHEDKKSIKLQSYSLILLVMLMGHMVSDMMYGGSVMLFYPFSQAMYGVPTYEVLATSGFYSPIVTGNGLVLMTYTLILLSVVFLEDFIYFFEKRHKSMKKALRSVRQNLI